LDAALTSTNASVSSLIDQLDVAPTAGAINGVLSALNPGVYAELGNVGMDRLRDLQSGLSNHLDMLALDSVSLNDPVSGGPGQSASNLEGARAWSTAFGGWGKRNSDSDSGSPGYSISNYGNVSGVETNFGDITLGITGALGTTNADFAGGKGAVTTDSWHAGVYGSVPTGLHLVLNASFAYGQTDSRLKRTIPVSGGGSTAGKSEGSEWTGQIGAAVPLRAGDGSVVVTPSVNLIHSSVTQDALTESSVGGLEASVGKNSTATTSLRTGVQAAKLTRLADKPTRLTASIDWVHSFNNSTSDADIALTGAGSTSARFRGSRGGNDTFRVGVGAEIALTERTRIRLNVDERLRNAVQSTFGSATVTYQF